MHSVLSGSRPAWAGTLPSAEASSKTSSAGSPTSGGPAAERYLADRVATASPAELTAMVFDLAVTSARKGAEALEALDHASARRHLLRAQDAVFELISALDPSADAALAQRLGSLYSFAVARLVHANVHQDPQAAADAESTLEPLRTAWRQACLGRAA